MTDATVVQLVTVVCGAVVAIATIIGNVLVYRKTVQTHDLVNSSSSQLLELTRKSALAEGRLRGASIDMEEPPRTSVP